MDPVMNYRLGQIRQQELIDEAARYQRGDLNWLEAILSSAWERLGTVLSNVTAPRTQMQERAAQPNLIATSR